MSKKIITTLVISNIITGLFLFMNYRANEELKKEILLEYISGQHEINMSLNNLIESYEVGSREAYLADLRQVIQAYYKVTLLSDNEGIEKHIGDMSDLFEFSWSGQSLIQKYVNKSATEDLNTEDIKEIQMLSDKMIQYTELLDYDELHTKNPNQILKHLIDLLGEVK